MSVHKFEDVNDLVSICNGLYDMSFVIIEPVVVQVVYMNGNLKYGKY